MKALLDVLGKMIEFVGKLGGLGVLLGYIERFFKGENLSELLMIWFLCSILFTIYVFFEFFKKKLSAGLILYIGLFLGIATSFYFYSSLKERYKRVILVACDNIPENKYRIIEKDYPQYRIDSSKLAITSKTDAEQNLGESKDTLVIIWGNTPNLKVSLKKEFFSGTVDHIITIPLNSFIDLEKSFSDNDKERYLNLSAMYDTDQNEKIIEDLNSIGAIGSTLNNKSFYNIKAKAHLRLSEKNRSQAEVNNAIKNFKAATTGSANSFIDTIVNCEAFINLALLSSETSEKMNYLEKAMYYFPKNYIVLETELAAAILLYEFPDVFVNKKDGFDKIIKRVSSVYPNDPLVIGFLALLEYEKGNRNEFMNNKQHFFELSKKDSETTIEQWLSKKLNSLQ